MAARARRASIDEESGFGDYIFVKTLGEGSFGKVKLATHRHNNKKYAVKVMERSRLVKEDDMTRAMREVQVLSLLRHPNISRLYDVHNTATKMYLIMEYCSGGELFDYIVAHRRIKEKEARVLFREICSAIAYCHRNFIIHRDLKPENLLLDENKHIKIIDFGFTNTFHDQELLNTFCGSPAYAAPEMVVGKAYLAPNVDIWSLGVLLFAIVCGYLPFDDPNVHELFKKIVKGEFTLPDHLSNECCDLISSMLKVNSEDRASLDSILNHPWTCDGFSGPPDDFVSGRVPIEDIDSSIVDELVSIGFPEAEIQSAIENNTNNIVLCSYYLLQEKKAHDEAEAEELRQSLVKSAHRRRKSSTDDDVPSGGAAVAPHLQAIGESESLDTVSPAVPATRQIGAQAGAVAPRKRRHSVAVGDATTDAVAALAPLKELATPATAGGGGGAASGSSTAASSSSSSSSSKGKEEKTEEDEAPALPEVKAPGRKRRFSLDTAMASITNALSSKKGPAKAQLRTVKGPFSVASTSSKTPEEIMAEVERVLGENNIAFQIEDYQYDCTTTADGQALRFQLEICKLERLTLNGLRLKRVTGDTWAYKRLCLLILSQMKL